MSLPPKLFVSYSWSTSEHEQWVVDLATELVESGVDVVLDKWALREGHDAVAFMEKMVTDTSITKVMIVCDKAYATKADGRAAGVGTETQIISAEVYAKKSQDKFVAVIAERDDSGNPCLPTYYKSRIYVDLSESDRYAENFEKLLRWIFDKPLYVRPELGKPPSFLADTAAPVLGTSALAKRVIDGLKGDKGYAKGALDEYLNLYCKSLERFRITSTGGEPDERVVESIEEFLPSRNEFISILIVVSQYSEPMTIVSRLHRFFESMIPYFSRQPNVNQWIDTDFDNFKFIVHELFLYTLAILLRSEHIDAVAHLLSLPYYIPENSEYGRSATVSYADLCKYTKSLDVRNQRLGLNLLSLRATLLEQRSKTSGVEFRDVMQADFICFLRSSLTHTDKYDRWLPETLLYTRRQYGPFALFARSASKAYLVRTLKLLDIADVISIKTKLDEYVADCQSLPRWGYHSINIAVLVGFDLLGTRV